jgi:hypothetical protein
MKIIPWKLNLRTSCLLFLDRMAKTRSRVVWALDEVMVTWYCLGEKKERKEDQKVRMGNQARKNAEAKTGS